MCTSLRQPLTELPQGATLRIHDGRDRGIAVFAGQVWITQANDLRDTVIGAGESFTFDRPGLTLVQAFSDTRLMLIDAEPQPESIDARISAPELRRAAVLGAALAHAIIAAQTAVARGFNHLRAGWVMPGRAARTRSALQGRS
jgi:hypothetical protein